VALEWARSTASKCASLQENFISGELYTLREPKRPLSLFSITNIGDLNYWFRWSWSATIILGFEFRATWQWQTRSFDRLVMTRWVNDIQMTQRVCDIYLMPVAGLGSIFGPLSQTHFSKRVFLNEISSSALLDIQPTLLFVCEVNSFLPETSSATHTFPTRLLGSLEKTNQNLEIWPFLNSRLEMWVWEKGQKIDSCTGVNQCFGGGTNMRSRRRMKTWTSCKS